jgi:peptide/nickel transport system permease protein
MFANVGPNRRDKGRHAAKGAPAETLAGDLGEEALEEIQPGRSGRGEMEMNPRVRQEPGLHRRMLVGAVVVENEMEVLAARGLPIDDVQERNEFGVGVARLTPLDYVPLEDIQRRKERGRTVPLIVMRLVNSAHTIPVPEALSRPWTLPRPLVLVLRFCGRKPLGAIGAVIIVVLVVMAVFADRIAPYHYDETIARMKPPSLRFWMGTDNLGRDIWSRVVYGARISVTVGFATVVLGTVIATSVGVSSAYLGGAYDIVVQRVVDAWMSFPALVIILSLLAALGPGLLNLVLALSILGAAGASRVIRGATLSVMQNPFIDAARALGAGHARILLRSIVPNITATVIILATIGLGTVILAESALSFLGFGVPPPFPSWGGMLSGSGRTFMCHAPWMALWPDAAISLAVFGFNMLGDALRDVLDPRLRGTTAIRIR